MKSRFRSLCVVSAVLSLAGCDKPPSRAAAEPFTAETDNHLAQARDALERQALEIETKTALMDKQLAEMEQSLKDRDNAELQSKLEALKKQNEEMRAQADAARRQSDAVAERIAATPAPKAPPPAASQPDYSMFYERLAPYGRWSEVNGYGYCWQPTISIAGWRPYLDGCWVWSEFGWAWQSNEPFGWATYHYGRWLNLASYGWVWVPGSEWAPAWVAWRQSSDCVGWAPLPPEQGICSGVYRDCDSRYGLGPSSYVFINTYAFVSRSYVSLCASVSQRAKIFQRSVNVTQIVPRSGQRHAFVQQGGPPRAQMENACKRQVPQRPVQRLHAGQMPAQWLQYERTEAHAPVAIVELPVLAPSAPVRHPEVREHFQDRDRVGGFEGTPHHDAEESRNFSAQEKETAIVHPPKHQSAHGHTMLEPALRPFETPHVTNVAPVANAPVQENSRPAIVAKKSAEAAAVPQAEGKMSHESRWQPVETTPVSNPVSTTIDQSKETVRSAVDAEHPVVAAQHGAGAGREHGHPALPAAGAPAIPRMPLETKVVDNSTSPAPLEQVVVPAMVENKLAVPLSAAGAPVLAPAQTTPVVVTFPPQVMPQQPAVPIVSQPPVPAEKMTNDQGATNTAAEQARLRASADQQAQTSAKEQRQQRESQERAMAEKKAAEQTAADAEKARQQAAAVAAQQQQDMSAQQQRQAADQAAADAEKARQQAVALAAQQQQDMAAQQQRQAADQAAADAEKARQQAAAVAAQQQQDMAAQQQRQAADQAAADAEKARQQAAAVAAQQQQDMVVLQQRQAAEAERVRQQTEAAAMQRQADEAARRQQEAENQRAQEQARRAAEEQQMRAQQEAERRAQEMAQRQADEAARRQQEAEMQRAQEQARAQQEAAQRAAAEAARNQPQPTPGT